MNRRDVLWGIGAMPILLVPRIALARLGAAYFTNFILTTQGGKQVRFYDDLVRNKIVAINFIYTGCTDICPAMTQNLVDVQALLGDKVGREIFMYSITLQPERDTPEMLKTYADLFGVGPGWLFLRAQNDAETTVLRRKLGFYDPDPKLDADLETHIGLLRFGNDRINRWAACPALTEPHEIVQEIGWMEDGKLVRSE